MTLKVLIAGGGLSGLCLAHGLRRTGIEVEVFERDEHPAARRQGYRIHMDRDGDGALAACLPPDLFALYRATSARVPRHPRVASFDQDLRELGAIATAPELVQDPERAPTGVNRLTLREILLARLGDVVHFGCEAAEVTEDSGGVRVRFAGGRSATGDVLVGADGINSVVRSFAAPDARVHDTGLRAVTGKTPLADGEAERLPDALQGVFTGIRGPHRRGLAVAVYRSRRPHRDAAAELAPDVDLTPVGDYAMWVMLAPSEAFPLDDETLRSAAPAALHEVASGMADGWHPSLRELLARAETDACFPLLVRASHQVPAWSRQRTTLLGDAAHAMTPIGGRGGNTALWDAARLTEALAAAARGDVPLPEALERYGTAMREHGFRAVEDSLQGAARLGGRVPTPAP